MQCFICNSQLLDLVDAQSISLSPDHSVKLHSHCLKLMFCIVKTLKKHLETISMSNEGHQIRDRALENLVVLQ